jgi:Zn-dependent alcohol dehydrogenase
MPITVRAGVVSAAGRPPEVEDIVVDDPGPGEVLIRIKASGICHTDLAVASGDLWPNYPIVLGHEISGVVEAVGAGVSRVKLGDRVVTVDGHCGRCHECEHGHPVLCKQMDRSRRMEIMKRASGEALIESCGGFAEATVLPEEDCHVVPDGVPFEVAAITGCSVVTGAGAVFNVARVEPGQAVAVLGAGGVGASALMAARASGAAVVVLADPNPSRRELGLKLGADLAVDPTADALLGAVPQGFDAVIEAAGKVPAMELAVEVLRPGGAAVIIGAVPEETTFRVRPLDLLLNQKRVLGCLRGDLRPDADFPRYFDLYQRGLLDLDALVTSTISLDEIAKGFDRSAAEEGIRTVIVA